MASGSMTLLTRARCTLRIAALVCVQVLAGCSDVAPAIDAPPGQGSGATPASGGRSVSGDAGRANGGDSGSSDDGSAGSSSELDAPLGARCASQTECGTGLTCLLPSSAELEGAGPPNGLCTAQCDSDADCAPFEPGAGCFSYGTHAYCLQACALGEPADLARKCRGRPDFACTEVDTEAFCVPLCRADVECGASRFCDRTNGRCVRSKPTGDPVGAPCNPSASTVTCLGICLRTSAEGLSPATGVCAEPCAGLIDCMYDDAGQQAGGVCWGALSDPFGALDLGYCLPSCDCSGECSAFGGICRAWTSAEGEFERALGKTGLCYENIEDSVELSCR